MNFLQLNWRQIAADIEAGELTHRVTDASVREAVAGVLIPDPGLAEFIRAECTRADWAGLELSRAFGRTPSASTLSPPAPWRRTSRT
jgi:hypothetical protein